MSSTDFVAAEHPEDFEMSDEKSDALMSEDEDDGSSSSSYSPDAAPVAAQRFAPAEGAGLVSPETTFEFERAMAVMRSGRVGPYSEWAEPRVAVEHQKPFIDALLYAFGASVTSLPADTFLRLRRFATTCVTDAAVPPMAGETKEVSQLKGMPEKVIEWAGIKLPDDAFVKKVRALKAVKRLGVRAAPTATTCYATGRALAAHTEVVAYEVMARGPNPAVVSVNALSGLEFYLDWVWAAAHPKKFVELYLQRTKMAVGSVGGEAFQRAEFLGVVLHAFLMLRSCAGFFVEMQKE
ncbi:MAG TPA: hypothetical protein VKD22_17340 [Ramlibacter sp.]|nr:hypothetical protein [Ramlibacter sp.]